MPEISPGSRDGTSSISRVIPALGISDSLVIVEECGPASAARQGSDSVLLDLGWGMAMPGALKVTRLEHTAAELRRVASKSHDGEQVRRLLALALILEGVSREEAAVQNGMDRQTLRDWVIRYNDFGIEGLR